MVVYIIDMVASSVSREYGSTDDIHHSLFIPSSSTLLTKKMPFSRGPASRKNSIRSMREQSKGRPRTFTTNWNVTGPDEPCIVDPPTGGPRPNAPGCPNPPAPPPPPPPPP